MRTLASLGMGEGQLWVIVLCCSCVRCWRWAVLELMMSQFAFFGEGMLKKWEGEERGYWLLQEGLLLEKKETMNE